MGDCTACKLKHSNNIKDKANFETSEFYKRGSYDYLYEYDKKDYTSYLVEIQFKNTRTGLYLNKHNHMLSIGDLVAVEAKQGHDIGRIKMFRRVSSNKDVDKVGDVDLKSYPIIYRKAGKTDKQKWEEAKNREKSALKTVRQTADEMGLDMKISDVDIQGDNSKIIIFYIADGRVDFRELIKVYAKKLKLRIEMKQIGARQEAAMVGGIGSCGRELCCSSWRTDFETVSSQAARYQELPLNAQRMAGQCGKLKCCLMYELDTYIEAKDDFPEELLELETKGGIVYKQKIDVLKKIVYYAENKSLNQNELIAVPLERVKQIIQLNKRGIKVKHLIPQTKTEQVATDDKIFKGKMGR
ncbi:MAG: hypothetical protein MI922_30105 [Bacteroidales bacterium]|nr:hypothetical protein [Bacteroidales bacterium]